jgi:hypothetical protein
MTGTKPLVFSAIRIDHRAYIGRFATNFRSCKGTLTMRAPERWMTWGVLASTTHPAPPRVSVTSVTGVLFLRQSGLLVDANARARLWSRSSELSDTKQGLSDTKCRLGILTATGRGGVIYMDASNEEFVLVVGVVYRRTSLGVFLDVVDRCVFIPANCTSTPSVRFRPGETVKMAVLRSFAEQEELVA